MSYDLQPTVCDGCLTYDVRRTTYDGLGQRGIALVLVVSVLAIVGIMATSFAFWMRMEQRAASNFLETVRTRHLAEAAVAHARLVLQQDRWRNGYDGYDESWAVLFQGSDADLDDDGAPDARWMSISIPSENSSTSWRYAVMIRDEAGKVNVNSAGRRTAQSLGVVQGWTTFDVDLESFLVATGAVSDASGVADAVMSGRYGADGRPGAVNVDDDGDNAVLTGDGIDNDADGQVDESQEGVDEPDEFHLWWPLGDDQPWLTVDAVRTAVSIENAAFEIVRQHLTAHSRDLSIYPSTSGDVTRWINQWNLNVASADDVLAALIAGGVTQPWSLAANIADWVDADLTQSLVAKKSLMLSAFAASVQPGGWSPSLLQGAYENHQPGSEAGVWSWSGVPVGSYYLAVYGGDSEVSVGAVTIGGIASGVLTDASYFPEPVTVADDAPTDGQGVLQVVVANPSLQGSEEFCRFSAVELIPISGGVGLPVVFVRGAETVRINETFVSPQVNRSVSQLQQPGGDWVWQDEAYRNATAGGGAQGEGDFTWGDVPDGQYYLRFYGGDGQMIGDVTVNGIRQDGVRDGDRWTVRPSVTVAGSALTVKIQNNLLNGACIFKSIVLSQQPDVEYVELFNLGDRAVDLGGWQLQGTGSVGWPARIPLGTQIEPRGYLVLAPDADDQVDGLSSNGISVRKRWGGGTNVVQLDFEKSVTPEADLLRDAPREGEDFIVLRDASGNIVDVAEYLAVQVAENRVLEKADPTAVSDGNGNGVGDGWYGSEAGGTPGRPNDNAGMREQIGEEEIVHGQDEVIVRSGPVASIGEVGQIGTGEPWRTAGPDAISKLADVATVFGVRLDLERAASSQAEGWQEQDRAPPQTAWFISATPDSEGAWAWDQRSGIVNGVYTLRVSGRQSEGIRVAVQRADGSWSSFSPVLEPGPSGMAIYGTVEIGTGSAQSAPSQTLAIRIKNGSLTGTAHADFVQLDPQLVSVGRLNVNTAPVEVLQALPGVDAATAEAIIANRPYERTGDLLLSGAMGSLGSGDGSSDDRRLEDQVERRFAALANLVTVRSNVYEVVAVAQAVRGGRVVAQQKVRTVIER